MYNTMKKLINSLNAKKETGRITDAQYEITAESYRRKIDIYLAHTRITDEEADELFSLLETKEK